MDHKRQQFVACTWSLCEGKFENMAGLLIEFAMLEVYRELLHHLLGFGLILLYTTLSVCIYVFRYS